MKYRYRLGFEATCAEVTNSIAWRRLCRIGLGEAVPHASTSEEITNQRVRHHPAFGDTRPSGYGDAATARSGRRRCRGYRTSPDCMARAMDHQELRGSESGQLRL